MNTLSKKEDRQYLKYSSLTVTTNFGHCFEHNIFKEYFVSKCVSQKNSADIIKQVSIPGTQYLNPNWFNILGLILQSNSSQELESWLFEAEPLALTKLEADRVSLELRYSVLVATLEEIIDKDIWFRSEVCSEEELAAFVQSSEAVDLLIRYIEAPVHFRSLYFCLSVLSCFSNLYEADAKIREVLVSCYQSDTVRAYERRVAISAIAALKLNTPEITDDLIHRFAESRSSYERLGVYEYLQQSHLCDENLDFLLQGIKYLSFSYRDDEITNGTEHFVLIECLSCVSDPVAIEKAIEWYSHEDNIDIDFYDRTKLFSGFFEKATKAYCSGHLSLFETVYSFFANAMRLYSRYHILDALNFFSVTGMMEAAFTRLVFEDAENRLFMIEDTIRFQPDLIDVFCRLYTENKLKDQEMFKQYALHNQGDPVLFEKCAEAIWTKTGEVLTSAEPRWDYDLQQRKDMQIFFDCLFSPQDMRTLLIRLADSLGNREITCEQLRESRTWHDRYPEGTYMLEIALLQSGLKKERIIDSIDLIDWDCFFINRICYLFNTEKALTSLTVSENQHRVLLEAYKQLEEQLDYHTAFTEPGLNSYRFSSEMHYYMILKKALDLPSPDDYYLGLLEIPSGFVNEQSNVGEKYGLIEQRIARDDIVARIEKLAPQETQISVLNDLMLGCRRYQIKSCREAAIQLCRRNEVSAYHRRNALEYLFEVFGPKPILNEIMPTSDNELFEIIVDVLRETADDCLKSEMILRYKREPSNFLLKNLIALNVPEGLQIYIDKSKEENGICDYSRGISEVTETISEIHDISLLPLLLDAVRMRFSGSFKDGSFHTLYHSLQNALSACAKTGYDLVWESINGLKDEPLKDREIVGFCSVLQANMIEANKMSLIKKWTAPEVRTFLQGID